MIVMSGSPDPIPPNPLLQIIMADFDRLDPAERERVRQETAENSATQDRVERNLWIQLTKMEARKCQRTN